MKSKIKQLLVGVLTVAVISSNFAAALIPGAATITGTIAVTENKTVVASTTDTTVDVPVKVTFTEAVTGPHGRFSITADGATLTDIKVDSFDNANAEENPDAYVRIGDEYGADGTNLEKGTILIESAIDNKAAVVTYINLVATFTVPANTDAGTVIPVTVKGIDATNANEDNWEDLVATNGNITVTAAEPEATISDYIVDTVLNCKVDDQSVNGTVTYDADASKAIATYVDGLGGDITKLGLIITWDGSDPATSETGSNGYMAIPTLEKDNYDGTAAMINGLNLGVVASAYYRNMNIYQIASTNVRFISYVEYVVNGETVTAYGTEKAQVLMDYLKTQTEDEKAVAIVNTYDLAVATESENVVSTTDVFDANYGPTIKVSYNLADIKVEAVYDYTADQSKAIATYVDGLGGDITKLGMVITWDGSNPTTSTTGSNGYMAIPTLEKDNYDGTAAMINGLALSGVATGYYQKMNVKQFASEVKYAAYVTYSLNGEEVTEFLGEVKTYKFIDLIQDNTSELAVAYKDLYTKFVG